MANSVSEVLLTNDKLDRPAKTAATTGADGDLSAGAIVDFWGVVRQLEDDRELNGIDYEAHEAMARHQMQLIADAANERFGLRRLLLHHRIGFVPAGEASLFLRVTAPHRGAAFEASEWIVDELKKKVPIWKKPKFRTASLKQQSETVTAR